MSNNNSEGEKMSSEADKAAERLRTWIDLVLGGHALDDVRDVLDDRERLIGELREAQEKLAAQQQPVRWVVTQQELDNEAKALDAVWAKFDELGQKLDRLTRQQVDDSDDHEARLLRLDRLHGLAVEST